MEREELEDTYWGSSAHCTCKPLIRLKSQKGKSYICRVSLCWVYASKLEPETFKFGAKRRKEKKKRGYAQVGMFTSKKESLFSRKSLPQLESSHWNESMDVSGYFQFMLTKLTTSRM